MGESRNQNGNKWGFPLLLKPWIFLSTLDEQLEGIQAQV